MIYGLRWPWETFKIISPVANLFKNTIYPQDLFALLLRLSRDLFAIGNCCSLSNLYGSYCAADEQRTKRRLSWLITAQISTQSAILWQIAAAVPDPTPSPALFDVSSARTVNYMRQAVGFTVCVVWCGPIQAGMSGHLELVLPYREILASPF